MRVLLIAVTMGLSIATTGCASGESSDRTMKNQLVSTVNSNRLSRETSPYLLQHATNPVDWYPWGEEAFQKAHTEDKPIFLSIGYSACHWCHVMAHESFEDEAIAGLLNKSFVAIKVDREERPDVDTIYMNAVQIMTGSGGWPLSVFLTPELEPFFGGTYFPPDDRFGLPGFPSVLTQLADAWNTRRTDVTKSADSLAALLRSERTAASTAPTQDRTRAISNAANSFLATYDDKWGGFGGAPKFPPSGTLGILLRQHAHTAQPQLLETVRGTLDKMASGGMYDQIGGGFHRYSVDRTWLVTHFEKMLYDNALLSRAYLEAYQVTGDSAYLRIATEVLDYVLRDMTDECGAFHAAEDADSEGKEGKFYVWSKNEVMELLGPDDGELASAFFGVTQNGNFEGENILTVRSKASDLGMAGGTYGGADESRLRAIRAKLFQQRAKRIRPGKDDKILAGWNGLMISSFAYAYQMLGNNEYLEAATRAASFIRSTMHSDKILLRSYRAGVAKLPAYLDDYAMMGNAYLDLYESTFDDTWFHAAQTTADQMLKHFIDPQGGALFYTSADHKNLLTRTKPQIDSSIPSGNSAAALLLLRLSLLTGAATYRQAAEQVMDASWELIDKRPGAVTHMLAAVDFSVTAPIEIALIGHRDAEDTQQLLRTIHRSYLPNKVVALLDPSGDHSNLPAVPLLRNRGMQDNKATVYICQNFACKTPMTNHQQVDRFLHSDSENNEQGDQTAK